VTRGSKKGLKGNNNSWQSEKGEALNYLGLKRGMLLTYDGVGWLCALASF